MTIVSVIGGSAEEGDGSNDTFPTVSINLNQPATAPIQVGYRLLSGTGQIDDDADISGFSRSVTFQAGEQSKTVSLRTDNDTVPEPDEALVFEAFVISGNAEFPGGSPVGRATVFLLDEDGFATPDAIFVSRPVLTEGDGGTQTANFEVALSRPASSGFSVPWTTQAGSATAGEDFIAASGTLSFVPGQQRATIGVQVLGDDTVEPDEQFTVRFTPPGGFGEVSIGSATILDDDTAPNGPSVSAQGASSFEGLGSGTNDAFPVVAIHLSEPATATSTAVGYRLVSGTAQVGTDIDISGFSRSVTFREGEQSKSVTLRTDNDSTAEADEFALFEVFIQNTATNNARVSGGRPVDQAIVWVLDDDGSGQPAIGITSPTVVEGDDGRSSAAVKVSLSRPATEAFQINYSTQSNGSAQPGRDYVAVSGAINVAPGQQEFSFNVPIIGDREQESQESFLLSLAPSTFYAGASVSTITILDDDVAPAPPTAGNDLIDFRGFTAGQTIDGLGGNDTIFGGLAGDVIDGNAGSDTIRGDRGGDLIRGGAGFDLLYGDGGNDVLRGGDGNDRMFGGVGDDRLYGEAGFDLIFGGGGADQLWGGTQADTLSGEAGNDTIRGEAGDDRLEGGAGGDLLDGGVGDDKIFGGTGGDRLFGGEGRDLLGGDDGGDRLAGGAGADNMYGGAGNDLMLGEGGADRMFGGAGSDRLQGGAGNDTILGGVGVDAIAGGEGDDLIGGEGGNDGLYGGGGNDNIYGGVGDDLMLGQGGDDRLYSGAGDDVMQGGGGADELYGEFGDDALVGNAGADLLSGGAGFDVLVGGSGNDRLQGDFNADQFVFQNGFGRDVITDFEATNDFERIDLSNVSSITGFGDLSANHLRQQNANAVIDALDGNVITLLGVSVRDLDAADFVF
jgi:Ca2+-binding RTX toxin-like protein